MPSEGAPTNGIRSRLEEILYQYARGFDSADMDLLAECFAQDATMTTSEGTIDGRDAIIARFARNRAQLSETRQQPRHLILNVMVDDESASGAHSQCYFMFSLGTPGLLTTVTTGRYVDAWVNDGTRWRIRHRTVHNDTVVAQD